MKFWSCQQQQSKCRICLFLLCSLFFFFSLSLLFCVFICFHFLFLLSKLVPCFVYLYKSHVWKCRRDIMFSQTSMPSITGTYYGVLLKKHQCINGCKTLFLQLFSFKIIANVDGPQGNKHPRICRLSRKLIELCCMLS